jgi:putative endopeptidase
MDPSEKRKLNRKTRKIDRRLQRTIKTPQNSIPIPAPVSNFLFCQNNEIGNNFYTWVNKKWLDRTSIPSFESDFGVSEEAERVLFNTSKQILERMKKSDSKSKDTIFIKTLAESCLHSRAQQTSVTLLKQIIHTLDCIKTKEDVMREFGTLCKRRFPSLFILQYTVDKDSFLQLLLDGNMPNLPLFYYKNRSKFADYKLLLHKAGNLLDCPDLHKVAEFEKTLVFSLENTWSNIPLKSKGSILAKKFSGIPWNSFFEGAGLDASSWKSQTIYYKSPIWIRHIGKLLKTVPIEVWKLLIARSYIIGSLKYLPPPFDELDHEFFNQGQTVKTPQMELLVNIVYSYLPDLFSRVFWEEAGSPEIEKLSGPFVKNIVNAAKHRLSTVEWLSSKTREKGIEKIDRMRIEIVKPTEFPSFEHYELDNKNLLHNLCLIGEKGTQSFYKRMGHRYKVWEEGIYRVNAYYFNENNEIMIPYGTMISPFYSVKASDAWNYGALGSIIGHEMCHGFDEDGKDYDEYGQRKSWWTRRDNIQFNRKKKELIDLYSKQTVLGKKVNGKKTLSENIADLGGLGIALHALKEKIGDKPLEEKLAAYREFFIAFATSWRTKYRDEKLQQSLETDRHSPAFLRVNLIVSQFDEWYEAFGIDKSAELYRSPEERIRIF